MNFNSEFNKENLIELYSANKQLVVSIIAIFISVILFVFIVLPQLVVFPSKKAEADQENIRLSRIQAAYDLLTSIDNEAVGSNLKIAQKTLPDKKDFESVLNAISVASGNSATQIIDYTFSSGGNASEKYPTLLFKIETFGGINEAVNFINELYKTYPLSDVTSLISSDNISKMDIVFYYRAFPPITIDDRITVTEMNEAQNNALKIISGWQDTTSSELEIFPEASASSTTPF